MAGLRVKDIETIAELVQTPRVFRRRTGEKQVPFWNRFGVTQSGGSRYERLPDVRKMPLPLAILTGLYALGYVSDEDIADVREALKPLYRTDESTEIDDGLPTLRPAAKARAAVRKVLRERGA